MSTGMIVGGTNKSNIKLLWSNPSPSAAFTPQTVSLDLKEYDEVVIDCVYQSGTGSYSTAKVPKGSAVEIACPKNLLAYRKATVSETGVEFSFGYYVPTYGGNGQSTENGIVIPLRIYGITL